LTISIPNLIQKIRPKANLGKRRGCDRIPGSIDSRPASFNTRPTSMAQYHAQVTRALDALARGLAPYVEEQMEAVYQNRWRAVVQDSFRGGARAAPAIGGSAELGRPFSPDGDVGPVE
jgi:hypothetical protein